MTTQEKLIKELSKLPTEKAIEEYHSLGKWLHDEIEKKMNEANELQDKLNNKTNNQ